MNLNCQFDQIWNYSEDRPLDDRAFLEKPNQEESVLECGQHRSVGNDPWLIKKEPVSRAPALTSP